MLPPKSSAPKPPDFGEVGREVDRPDDARRKAEGQVRKELKVNRTHELYLMNKLRDELLLKGLNASNTVIVTVSTDYSSVIGQYLRHQLTKDGEICDGFGIDVPYPDQEFDEVLRFCEEDLEQDPEFWPRHQAFIKENPRPEFSN